MMHRFLALCGLVLSIVLSCDGGELDVFKTQPGTGGSPTGGSSTGGSSTGGRSGDTSMGGEGGDGPLDMIVIDDFEDGDQEALLGGGQWYVANDGTGVQTFTVAPSPVEWPGSEFSAHTTGTGFESFGAFLGLDLAGSAASFDASNYAALSFVARVAPSSTRSVLFAFVVGSQHFAVPLQLGTDWERHTIPFSAALPVENGPLDDFDPSQIAGIQFFVPNDASFDYWLDDLAFVQ
jgi:hypothetical protein